MKLFFAFLIAFLFFQSQVFASQGVELEVETIEGEYKDTVKMVVLQKNIKVEVKQGNPSDTTKDYVIFDGKKMCTIDNKNNECNCMTKEDIKKMVDELNKQMASFDIDEMLKDVPPEYRQQAKEMMQKRMPKQVQNGTVAKPDLKKIGSENYNGYPSTKYILNNKNEEKIHLWVTNWNNVKGGKEISDAFINLGKFFDDLIEATSKISQGFNQDNNNYMRILDDVNGFIHSSKTYENGNLESETRLKNSYKRSVSLSEFSSPYTCKNPMSQL